MCFNENMLNNSIPINVIANGLLVRDLYGNIGMNHARRVVNIVNATKEDLSVIIEEDCVV